MILTWTSVRKGRSSVTSKIPSVRTMLAAMTACVRLATSSTTALFVLVSVSLNLAACPRPGSAFKYYVGGGGGDCFNAQIRMF